VASRGRNRNRIEALEAFVRSFDEYIGVSLHANTMSPADESHAQVMARLRAKQAEVSRARNVVGPLAAKGERNG